jgi:hypothetical protein
MSLSAPADRLIPLRDARDRIIQILGIGVPYPLRDLPLDYPEMVAVGQGINIKIVGAQTGVRYRLCDEEGNDLDLPGSPYEVVPKGTEGDAGVVLTGPSITQDVAYTIMAVREGTVVIPGVLLETYLNQVVVVMVGINKGLAAAFVPRGNQIARDNQLFVDYGELAIEISLKDSQEGVTYQLFEETADQKEGALLSDLPVKGLGVGTAISLTLKSGITLKEDTRIKIKARRETSGNKEQLADLDVRLTVQVRPDQDVVIQADPLILEYSAAPKLRLIEFQKSAVYTLYGRPLVSTDYHATKVPGDLEVANGEGGSVFVEPPARITNADDPAGFVKLGDFAAASGRIPVDPLVADTLFIVRATKKENGETLQLNQVVVVLVRPDPKPTVTALRSTIPSGTNGTVVLKGTQLGVRYQLRNQADEPVGAPGYHWEDRGVEAMRLEVDFVVEQKEPDGAGGVLWLPTGPLTEKTTFSVLATKVITGVTNPLDGTVVIDIKAPPPPDKSLRAAVKPSVKSPIKPPLKAAAKAPVKAGVKPPAKPSVKPPAKLDVKPDVKAASKQRAKAPVKAAVKPRVKSAVKPRPQVAIKPRVQAAVKPGSKSIVKPSLKKAVKLSSKRTNKRPGG